MPVKKVLIVEDHEDNANAIAQFVRFVFPGWTVDPSLPGATAPSFPGGGLGMMAPSGPLVTTLPSCPEDGPPSPDPNPEEPPDAHATSDGGVHQEAFGGESTHESMNRRSGQLEPVSQLGERQAPRFAIERSKDLSNPRDDLHAA